MAERSLLKRKWATKILYLEIIMEFIKLKKLSVENSYLRLNTDVSDLEKSIETLGQLSPLLIDQDNCLLAGGRRYTALKNLGREEVWIKRVEGDSLQKELISIDENLVRKDLDKLELEANLRRAKELYTALLNNNSEQVEKIEKELQEYEEEIPVEESGNKIEILASQKFVKDVSEKTGMSHRQVFQAIERDEKASAETKKARSEGDLSIGQTNEVIKLSKSEQKKILPVIKDKTVREVRKIIKEAKANGIDTAVNNCMEEDQQAKEVKQLKQLMKKMSQLASTLELENIPLNYESTFDLKKDWDKLTSVMDNILTKSPHYPSVESEVHQFQ